MKCAISELIDVTSIQASGGDKMDKDKIVRLKITCYTPKGQAAKSSQSFGLRYLSLMNKPIETAVLSDSEFYYIYDLKEKAAHKMMNDKIPSAEWKIRKFYTTLMGVIGRANKLGKRGAWGLEKIRRRIISELHRKTQEDEKTIEDMIDAIKIDDLDYMLDFLSKPLFKVEEL